MTLPQPSAVPVVKVVMRFTFQPPTARSASRFALSEDGLASAEGQIVRAAPDQAVGAVLGGDSLFQQRVVIVQPAALLHELRLLEIDQHEEAVREALLDAGIERVEIGGAVGERLSLNAGGAGELRKGAKQLAARDHAAVESGARQQARKWIRDIGRQTVDGRLVAEGRGGQVLQRRAVEVMIHGHFDGLVAHVTDFQKNVGEQLTLHRHLPAGGVGIARDWDRRR